MLTSNLVLKLINNETSNLVLKLMNNETSNLVLKLMNLIKTCSCINLQSEKPDHVETHLDNFTQNI